jgi:hypothetical protein
MKKNYTTYNNMNTIIKYILLILFFILSWIVLSWLTNYPARMAEYNKHMCAVYGYQEDCKTPLK